VYLNLNSLRSLIMLAIQTATIFLSCTALVSANVYTESAIFERLCHFKNDGVVNHLNTVDVAMIADGTCRMFREELDGYALWHNPTAGAEIIAALKALPVTGKPSHFTLSAHEIMEDICPEAIVDTQSVEDEFTCRGSGYDVEVMAGAMHNWQRALCAPKIDAEWEGEFDPAYQSQQVALTAGFMCIIACDCNETKLPGAGLAYFAESDETASMLQKLVCSSVPWEIIDFADASQDVDILAELSAPLMEVCGCSA